MFFYYSTVFVFTSKLNLKIWLVPNFLFCKNLINLIIIVVNDMGRFTNMCLPRYFVASEQQTFIKSTFRTSSLISGFLVDALVMNDDVVKDEHRNALMPSLQRA